MLSGRVPSIQTILARGELKEAARYQFGSPRLDLLAKVDSSHATTYPGWETITGKETLKKFKSRPRRTVKNREQHC